MGFILFTRNCESPDQVRALVDQLRACVDHPAVPVLIDQEGGRVARLKPPRWRGAPPAATFGALARRAPGDAVEAARLNAQMIGDELFALGVNVDCAPVLDLPVTGSHDIIGDRALDSDPHVTAILGRAVCEGLMAGGVLPVLKHIPGHGRARADSHHELPTVDAPLSVLEETDFLPFSLLNDMPWAMTAHLLYTRLDETRPATISPTVIEEVIRGVIGFDGLLISDDISMKALSGKPGRRAAAAIAAGCDVVLHCNGDMKEMTAIADALSPMSEAALERFERGEAMRDLTPEPLDRAWAERTLDDLMKAA